MQILILGFWSGPCWVGLNYANMDLSYFLASHSLDYLPIITWLVFHTILE